MSSLPRILLPLAAALVLGLVAIVVALFLSGGDDDGLSEDELTYVADVCGALGGFAQSARPAVEQLTDPSDLAGIQQGLDDFEAAVAQLRATLDGMDPPRDVADQHDQIVAALAETSSSLEQVDQALRDGDIARLDELTGSASGLDQAFGEIDEYPPEFEEALRGHASCREAEGFFDGGEPQSDRFAGPRAAEADAGLQLPGEYIDLAAIYGGPYGGESPNTNAHVRSQVDYSGEQGLPPAGGPHWGSAACGNDPAAAPPFCGPAPWGFFQDPWAAETLVHNMEHGGVVVWYNTADQQVVSRIEDWANGNEQALLVVSPYPELAPETVAITAWSRRDKFPAGELDTARLQLFLEAHQCRFDPEDLCGSA